MNFLKQLTLSLSIIAISIGSLTAMIEPLPITKELRAFIYEELIFAELNAIKDLAEREKKNDVIYSECYGALENLVEKIKEAIINKSSPSDTIRKVFARCIADTPKKIPEEKSGEVITHLKKAHNFYIYMLACNDDGYFVGCLL